MPGYASAGDKTLKIDPRHMVGVQCRAGYILQKTGVRDGI